MICFSFQQDPAWNQQSSQTYQLHAAAPLLMRKRCVGGIVTLVAGLGSRTNSRNHSFGEQMHTHVNPTNGGGFLSLPEIFSENTSQKCFTHMKTLLLGIFWGFIAPLLVAGVAHLSGARHRPSSSHRGCCTCRCSRSIVDGSSQAHIPTISSKTSKEMVMYFCQNFGHRSHPAQFWWTQWGWSRWYTP